MRKIIYTLVLTVATVFMANAQTPIKAGVHAGYGSKVEKFALGVNGEVGVMDKLSIAPSFSYFFMDSNELVSFSFMEFNADVHYNFMEDKVTVYGLGGLSYGYSSVKFKGELAKLHSMYGSIYGGGIGGSHSSGKIGLNLGGGVNFNLDSNFEPFAELKFTLGREGSDQLFLGGGVRYIFK